MHAHKINAHPFEVRRYTIGSGIVNREKHVRTHIDAPKARTGVALRVKMPVTDVNFVGGGKTAIHLHRRRARKVIGTDLERIILGRQSRRQSGGEKKRKS